MGNFEILCGFGILLLILYRYLTATFDHWKKRGVPGPKPTLLFGTMKDVLFQKVFIGKYVKDLYDAYENAPFIGIFNMREPILMIKDPKIIKDVFIKDSSIFYNRLTYTSTKAEPLIEFLFFATGLMGQHLKIKLSPAFTPSKLKKVFERLHEPLKRMDNYLEELLLENDYVNCHDLAEKLTTDMVVSCFLGLDGNTLNNVDEEKNFLKYAEYPRGINWHSKIKFLIKNLRLYNLFGYYIFNNAKITQFYTDLLINAMEQRKKHAVSKHDFINLLMEIKENPGKLAELTNVTDQFLAAQMHGMFFAGIDTTIVTIVNTLYELALNQNIQDKLREEIQNIYTKSQKLRYEDINEMSYLDAVFKETLRKYPVAPTIERRTTSSYIFKNTKIIIGKDQCVIIPVYAIHYDPKIYPNPEVYDPERFTKEAILSRDPMHYIPFGHGTRYCIGERLGILQTKLTLISILQKYKIDVCQKTITSYIYKNMSLVRSSNRPIFLKMTKINFDK